MTIKQHLAATMRRWADRIDDAGAPKAIGWAFTFEQGRGIVFNDTGNSSRRRGCALWYLGNADYERAHLDAEDPGPWINWETMTLRQRGEGR